MTDEERRTKLAMAMLQINEHVDAIGEAGYPQVSHIIRYALSKIGKAEMDKAKQSAAMRN